MASFNPATTSNPAALGFIKPTPGTPVQVTSNFDNLSAFACQSLSIQAHPANGGNIYVLSNKTAADTVNGTNVLAILAAGQSIPFSGLAQGGLVPAQFWIDADAASCKAIPIVYGA